MATWIGNRLNNLRNKQLEDEAAAAHERLMASRQRFIESNPNAVSPWERQAIVGRAQQLKDRDAQWNHERDMLRQQGENDFRVAEQKRFGMAEQGMKAAEANAKASITNTEREWAGRENIATKQAENALAIEQERQKGGLQQHELEWGKGGGRERIAEIEGKSRVDVEKQRGTSAENINKATLESQERINNATLAAQQGRKGAMTPEQESAAARDLIKQTSRNGIPTLSYEDALKQIRGEGQTQNDIQTDAQGKKWRIVRDANGKAIGRQPVQ